MLGLRGGRNGDRLFKAAAIAGALVVLVLAGYVSSQGDGGLGSAVVSFVLLSLVFGFVMFCLLGGLAVAMTPPEQRAREKAARVQTSSQIPLKRWRGLAMMTKADSVRASCIRCKRMWSISGAVANTVAEQQNLANRLIRGGTRAEQLGATFTVGASGRRIAAGNEAERHNRELAGVLAAAACPSCGRTDRVMLTTVPRDHP